MNVGAAFIAGVATVILFLLITLIVSPADGAYRPDQGVIETSELQKTVDVSELQPARGDIQPTGGTQLQDAKMDNELQPARGDLQE